jgi:hypothetical protein
VAAVAAAQGAADAARKETEERFAVQVTAQQ